MNDNPIRDVSNVARTTMTPKVKRVVVELEDDTFIAITGDDILRAQVGQEMGYDHIIGDPLPRARLRSQRLYMSLTLDVSHMTFIQKAAKVEEHKEWEVVDGDEHTSAEAAEPSAPPHLEMGDELRPDGVIAYRENWMGEG